MTDSLVGRIYRSTDPRGGPERIVVTDDTGSFRVCVENEYPPYRPRRIQRRRLLGDEYEFVSLTPSFARQRKQAA